VKQHLAAVRMLFDWLVTGHVLEANPAHAVRGPKYVVKKGKTPVLTIDEARALLNSISVVVKTTGPGGQVHESADLPGLRDRALIGVMVYTFARIGAYIAAAGLAGDPDQPLFQTAAGKAGVLRGKPLWQQDAYRMIQRRAVAAGIETKIGNHTFRATGITAYLKNGGTLEIAQQIANHESPRTTKLYDRRQDQISLDEVERIAI